jgi:high-affinity iron transporter
MADGAMMATLVIVFRETLEAGLIVGIILAMLSRLGAMRYGPHVWAASLLAVGASVLAGWALSAATQTAQVVWERVLEGLISLAACGVLTYMVFWMDRQAKRIRPEVELRVETAVTRQDLIAIVLLPFLAVVREGAETVLFLKAVAIQSGGVVSLAGGLLGGLLAVAVTMAIFIGGRRVPLKALFRSTGLLLLIIAAGLLAYGIHELQELGWLPTVVAPVWDVNHLLNEREGLGAFLKALFGYNGNPSLLEVVGYLAYLAIVLLALRTSRRQPAAPPAPSPGAAPLWPLRGHLPRQAGESPSASPPPLPAPAVPSAAPEPAVHEPAVHEPAARAPATPEPATASSAP